MTPREKQLEKELRQLRKENARLEKACLVLVNQSGLQAGDPDWPLYKRINFMVRVIKWIGKDHASKYRIQTACLTLLYEAGFAHQNPNALEKRMRAALGELKEAKKE